MIRFFHSTRPLALIGLPLVALLLWGIGIFFPDPVLESRSGAGLYSLIFTSLLPYPKILLAAGWALVVFEALVLNFVVEKQGLLNRKSYLTAFLFILLMSALPEGLYLSPVLCASLLLILAVYQWLKFDQQAPVKGEAFNSGFYLSLGSLFYFPMLALFPILFIALQYFRNFHWREWFIGFLGLLLPQVFAASTYFLLDRWPEYIGFWQGAVQIPDLTWSYPPEIWFYLSGLILLLLMGLFPYLKTIRLNKVQTKRSLLVLIWLFPLSLGSLFFEEQFSLMFLLLWSMPLAIYLANYFFFTKRVWLAETLLWLLTAGIIFHHLREAGL